MKMGHVSHQAKVTNVRAVRSTGKSRRTNQATDAADDGPDLTSTFESSGKVAPVYKDGVKSESDGQGRHKYATDSGVNLKHDERDQSFELKTPNGYTVTRGEDGLTAKDPSGKPIGNPTMTEGEQGQPFVNFKDKAGSEYKVNMQTLGMEATNKDGTVRQSVSPQGDQMVAIAPDGKKGQPEMVSIFEKGGKPDVDPDMKFSANGKSVTYETMDGQTHTKKLPLQVETGQTKGKGEATTTAAAATGGTAAAVSGQAEGAPAESVKKSETPKAATMESVRESENNSLQNWDGAQKALDALPEADQREAGKSGFYSIAKAATGSEETPGALRKRAEGDPKFKAQLDEAVPKFRKDNPETADMAQMNGYASFAQDKLMGELKPGVEPTQRQQNLFSLAKNGTEYGTHRQEMFNGLAQLDKGGAKSTAAGVAAAGATAGTGADYAVRGTEKATAGKTTAETEPGYMSKSGVSKTELEDGSVRTSLGNGAYVTEKPDGTVTAVDSKGKEAKVSAREFMNESGQADTQYTFKDGDNHHSVFKYSMDSIAENKDGSRAQIAHSDGRIFSAVREPNGKLHTSTIFPDGHPNRASEGVSQNKPGVMNVNGKEVEMPFGNGWKIPEKGQASDSYMQSSGVVPKAFPDLHEAQQGGHMHAAARPQPGYHPGVDQGGWGMDDGMGFGMPGMPGMGGPYHGGGMSKAMTFMMIASTLSTAIMPLMMMGGMSPMMMMF